MRAGFGRFPTTAWSMFPHVVAYHIELVRVCVILIRKSNPYGWVILTF